MADRNEALQARLLATFAVEAQEHLQALTANLLALHRGLPPAETAEVVESTFRAVHTLKGAARAVGRLDVEALCQGMEAVLRRITLGQMALSRMVVERLQEGVDGVAGLLAGNETPVAVRELTVRLEHASAAAVGEVAAPAGTPASHATAPTATMPTVPAPADTIRLATPMLDALLLQAEELLVPKLTAAERVQEVMALVEALTRCHTTLQRVHASLRKSRADGHAADSLAGLEAALQQVEKQARVTLGHLSHDARTLVGSVDGLLAAMQRLRMAPAATVLDVLPRMVHDLSREQGKAVEWVARGTDLEVDRKILEAIKDPLIHLVRNAIDHGIELPEVRLQAGKRPEGRVLVSVAALEGERLEIRVQDDGRGVDLARVRAAAVRSRALTAAAAASLSDAEAIGLLYRSGLSTSPIITNVSGHGLGLAIVKERVDDLGGEISLETQGGGGTTIRLVLPATIATFHGLLVRAGGQPWLCPTGAVERVIRVAPDEVKRVEGREVIRGNGHLCPIARLSEVLGLPEPADAPVSGGKRWGVILRSGEERAAFLVTEVDGDREGLVKELQPPLVRIRNVAGACLLGTGQVVLILRPLDLLRSIQAHARSTASPPAPEQEPRPPVILVVDDSITTRTMEQNLLEMAGYRVLVAADGAVAWDILKTEACALVLSDVDMPRLNGFELTAQIRADRTLADLPVILVTALASRADQERGIEVGANAYIVKADFDQSHLLELIRRLV